MYSLLIYDKEEGKIGKHERYDRGRCFKGDKNLNENRYSRRPR